MDAGSFELGTDGPSRILVGLDESETALHAAAYAAGTARRNGSQLIVVHVVANAPLATQVAATAGAMAQTQDEIATELERLVAWGAERTGLNSTFVLRRGNPYKEIVAVADELRVDLVTVGASTSSGRRFVGSLAGRLVRDARWPVTVVP